MLCGVKLSMFFFSVFINVLKRSDILMFPSELDSKVTSTSAQTTKITSPSPSTHRTSHIFTLEEATSNRQPRTSTTERPSKNGAKHEEKEQTQTETGNHTHRSCIQVQLSHF